MTSDDTSRKRWVPVSERLPDKFGCYITADTSGFVDCLCWHTGFESFTVGNGFHLERVHNVTHWMPLPEPPEQEQGE